MRQRRLAQHLVFLKQFSALLRIASDMPSVKDNPGMVLVQADGIRRNAQMLDELADELLELIPDAPVEVPPDED